jgi:WD40 repeat protein
LLPKIIPELPHSGKINGVHFGHDATRIMTVCHDGTYYVWNLAAKSYVTRYQADHFNASSGTALKFDNDRQHIQLVMPFAEPGANILEISYSKLGISDQIIRQLQFTTDVNGVLLRIQGSDGQDQFRALSLSDFYNSNSDPIHLVDLTRTSNREIVHFDWNSQTLIRQVVTQSDHQNIIIQNAHKKNKSFSASQSGIPWKLDSEKNRFFIFEQSGKNDAVESTLKVIDIQTLNQIGELRSGENEGYVSSIAFNQAGDRMLITYSSNDFARMKARFYKIKSIAGGTQLRITHLCDAVHPDGVLNGYVFHDGKRFATLGEDGEVKIWSMGKLLQRFKLDSQVHRFDITPDEKRLAATTLQGNIYLWDLEKYMPLGSPFFIVPGITVR